MRFRSALTYMAGCNGKNIELGVHWTRLISAAWLFLWCPFLFTSEEEDNRPKKWWNSHPAWWANEFTGLRNRKECFQMHHQNPPCQRENYSEGLNYWSSLSTSTLVTENLLQVIIHSVYRLKGCLSLPYANWPDLRNTSCRWALLLWVKRKQPQNKSTCLLGLSRFTTGFQLLSCFKLGISIKHLFKWKKMYMHICAATLTVLREYTLSSLTFTNHSCFHIRPIIPPQKSAFTYFFLIIFFQYFHL